MNRHVLILGAAGRLGRVLAVTFARAGWRTQAQLRGGVPPEFDGVAGLEVLRADALDASGIATAARGASVVINALNPVYHRWDELLPPLAASALDIARRLGALSLLAGNVYNYGNELPAVLRPDTPEQGNTARARLRIDMEAQLAATPGLDSIVLRAGDYFGGPGHGSWFDLGIVSRLKSGRVVYPGNPDLPHAWAYLPDLARAFLALAERREQFRGHQRLHFAGHTVTGREMAAGLIQATGRDLKLVGMPWWLFQLAAPFVPSWRAVLAMRYLWDRPHRLDGQALVDQVGPLPGTELTAALAQSIASLGLQGSLPTAGRPHLQG